MSGMTHSGAPLHRDMTLLPALLVLAAVLFNPMLAIVNAHVMPLTMAPVIAAEIAIVAAVHVLALLHYKRQMTPWYALIVIFVVLALFRSLITSEIDVKFLRDVLVIPTFIVLGMIFAPRNLTRLVIVLQIVVLAVMVFEVASVSAYGSLFEIKDYYVNTRGYDDAQFWTEDSNLYPSAIRPDDRFFGFLPQVHRLSSIFLEPVSLGNYVVIVVGFICAFWERLGFAARLFLIASTLLILVGSDGRLAFVTSLMIIGASIIGPRLPAHSAVLYLPVSVAAAFAVTYLTGATGGADNFSGRIAHMVELLSQYGLPELLGYSSEFLSRAVDSGLAYLVTTQSVIGVAILWCFITLVPREETTAQLRFTHAIGLYLATTMIVSFSLLSIKTAALLWFIQGALQGAARAHSASPRMAGFEMRRADEPVRASA